MTPEQDAEQWLTFRELDQSEHWPKGTAFRRFKQLNPGLEEGRDFVVLDAGQAQQRIEALRDAGRIYPASIQVVLLSPATAQRILKQSPRPCPSSD